MWCVSCGVFVMVCYLHAVYTFFEVGFLFWFSTGLLPPQSYHPSIFRLEGDQLVGFYQ